MWKDYYSRLMQYLTGASPNEDWKSAGYCGY